MKPEEPTDEELLEISRDAFDASRSAIRERRALFTAGERRGIEMSRLIREFFDEFEGELKCLIMERRDRLGNSVREVRIWSRIFNEMSEALESMRQSPKPKYRPLSEVIAEFQRDAPNAYDYLGDTPESLAVPLESLRDAPAGEPNQEPHDRTVLQETGEANRGDTTPARDDARGVGPSGGRDANAGGALGGRENADARPHGGASGEGAEDAARYDAEGLAKPETAGEPTEEKRYPCDCCGLMRTEAEGGKTFTVCDVCWDAGCSNKVTKCKPAKPEASGEPPFPEPIRSVACNRTLRLQCPCGACAELRGEKRTEAAGEEPAIVRKIREYLTEDNCPNLPFAQYELGQVIGYIDKLKDRPTPAAKEAGERTAEDAKYPR